MATLSTASMPLPVNVTPEQAIKALHNHDLMIKSLCPQLVSYTKESGDPSTSCIYAVTDKKPIGTTTYTLTLTSHPSPAPHSLSVLVNAKPPIGALNIASRWSVADGKLLEEADIDGNMITKKMGRDTVTKEHPKGMVKILEKAGVL